MTTLLTSEQATACVERAYGLRVLDPLVDLPQGVHSRAWLAHTDQDDWVVKVSDPRHESPATLLAQCEMYEFLNSHGLHAPDVLIDRSGSPVSTVTSSGVEFPVTVMRYHQLRRLAPETVSAEELRRIGTEIARLHATMEQFGGKDEIVANRDKSHDCGTILARNHRQRTHRAP